MSFLAKAIVLAVAVTALGGFVDSSASAFWLSFPGVGIDIQGPHGSVSFPYGAVRWSPHGGAVAFPGGHVKWRNDSYYVCRPSWHGWEPHSR